MLMVGQGTVAGRPKASGYFLNMFHIFSLVCFLIHWPSASPPPCPDRPSEFVHFCVEHCCVEHYHHSHHSVCYVLLVVFCCSLYPQQVQTRMKEIYKKRLEDSKHVPKLIRNASKIEAWGLLGGSWGPSWLQDRF